MLSKILRLLPGGYRSKLYAVAASILGSTILNLVGLAAILPAFILLLNGGDASRYAFIAELQSRLGLVEAPRSLMLLIATAIVLILNVKYLLSQALLRYQTRYIMGIFSYFSDSVLQSYYHRGYLYIKESGVTDINYKINSICYAAAAFVFQPILTIVAEGTLAAVTFACIAAISPFAALALLCSFIPTILVYAIVLRPRLTLYGRLQNRARNAQFTQVQELFSSYPSVELNQAFPKMHSQFSKGLDDISTLRLKSTLLSRFPNFMIELAVIISISLLMLFSHNDWGTLSLSISCFCAGALRLLPALRSVMSSHAQIKNNSYALDIILEALDHDEQSVETQLPINFERSISIIDLSFSFPDRARVIDSLNFTIRKGERIGIRGESGSGKSTLFNILLGLYPLHSASIKIDDTVLDLQHIHSWQKMIGYVPQDVHIINASIAENIAFQVAFETHKLEPLTLKEKLYDKPICEHFPIDDATLRAIDSAIDQAQLREFVDSLPDGIYTVIGECGCKLSGGQRQRIGIARALYKSPQILFFDEATSSLDPRMEREVNKAIIELARNRKELTMIIIAHRPESLQICDRIIDIKA